MPRIVAGGAREKTFSSFKTALAGGSVTPLLLVDSESPVLETSETPDSSAAWAHLQREDRWQRPAAAQEDQAQLMVTCMETWILGDRGALRNAFGSALLESAPPPENDLEARSRDQVLEALRRATKAAGPRKTYDKGRRSFQLLAVADPQQLKQHLPHFRRLLETLHRRL